MFSDLFIWWKKDVLLASALEGVDKMMKIAEEMFSYATSSFLRETRNESEIYEIDKSINKLEIETRKKVYEHLSINPRQDVTSSLILTTIVIDIERIGDYSKNIYELSLIYTPRKGTKYYEEAERLTDYVDKLLAGVDETFKEGDEERARKIMEEKNWLCQKCESIIKEIIIDEAMEVRPAVTYSLFFRHIKRVSAHTGNIASSIVNPFYRIGFKPQQ